MNSVELTVILFSHVFGQPAKKEYGIENIKVTNSAWDTNIISASGVRICIYETRDVLMSRLE